MKYYLLLMVGLSSVLNAQDFTWKKGTKLIDQTGIYGVMGTPTVANNPGGREGAATWKDANGNFWMFGGDGYDFIGNFGLLGDLWKYNPTTNQWAWIKGDDIINQLGSFGTKGISAASNKPSCRVNALSWVDASGNFWLFGGFGFDTLSTLGYLNDLWRYNVTTNEWTWMSGSAICYDPAVYGTLGVSSPSNVPGSRYGAVGYADATHLWLMSGFGNTTNSLTVGSLNDVWKYDIALNEWAWVNGSNLEDQNGTYGTMGSPSPANIPGGRDGATSWLDASGNFWIFGGNGWDASTTSNSGLLNDLWKYAPASNEFTWVKGGNSLNQIGVYGFQGTSDPNNFPGSRYGALSWTDAVGNMWLFAGEGYPGSASSSTIGELNDLWKYNTASNEWTWVRGSSVLDQHGNYGTLNVPAFTNIPGGRSFISGWMDASNNLWFFGGYGQPQTGAPGDLNDLWKYTNCFISPITLTVTSGDSTICAGETTSLTAIGGSNYLWTSNLSTNSYLVISPSVTTTYSVYTSDANSCKYYSTFTQTVDACTSIQEFKSKGLDYLVYPNPSKGEFYIQANNFNAKSVIELYNQLGELVHEQVIQSETESIQVNQDAGIYYYAIKEMGAVHQSGKIVIIN